MNNTDNFDISTEEVTFSWVIGNGMRLLEPFVYGNMLTVNLISGESRTIKLNYVPLQYGLIAAQQYCKRMFGTGLASISSEQQIRHATSVITQQGAPGNTQAWIGLRSKSGEDRWGFINDQDQCPSESHFKCVDFWRFRLNENTKYRPRCIGSTEQGHECAYFDGSDGKVDNDQDCGESKPFFCNAP